jgi:hypothetical protein
VVTQDALGELLLFDLPKRRAKAGHLETELEATAPAEEGPDGQHRSPLLARVGPGGCPADAFRIGLLASSKAAARSACSAPPLSGGATVTRIVTRSGERSAISLCVAAETSRKNLVF